MTLAATAARYILSDIERFSRLAIGLPLYDYQLEPARAVTQSVLHKQGHSFLLVFPRQSGKNEAVAQLLVYLLNLLQRRGGNLVFGATGDGLGRGLHRLEERLDNPWNSGRWRKAANPTRRTMGRAAVVFLSTHPQAAARGETAHWLLIIDELQDQPAAHIESVFEPMRAANNASALYIGTVKTTSDALWLKKQELESRQAADGLRRVFIVSPEEVAGQNPAYGAFLAAKVARLGRRHPVIASEYYNEPIDGRTGLFDRRRLALMRGSQRREEPGRARTAADGRRLLLATLDVAGQDEAATDPLARLANPGRDYTVAHIFEALEGRPDVPGPTYLALDVFVDHGSRHFQEGDGRPQLAARLLAWLEAWGISHLVADQSGVGAGLVDWLAAKMGPERVSGFTFNRASKAALGSAFLSLVETGRFHYWAGEELPLSDGWWFFRQAEACRYQLPPAGRYEQDLRWGVPPAARIDTPAGSLPLHDDRLISAALVAYYDRLIRDGKVRLGRAASAIIPPQDPLAGLNYP